MAHSYTQASLNKKYRKAMKMPQPFSEMARLDEDFIVKNQNRLVRWGNRFFPAWKAYFLINELADVIYDQWGSKNAKHVAYSIGSVALTGGALDYSPNRFLKIATHAQQGFDWANFAAIGVGIYQKKTSLMLTFFKAAYGIITYRNKTMVKNIRKGLAKYPEYNKLLVIVGMDHVEGMQRMMEADGFQHEVWE